MASALCDTALFFLPDALVIREKSLRAWPERAPVEMVGRSAAMAGMLERIAKCANFPQPVLVRGESGTGKELVARAVFLSGEPQGARFVDVNCPQHTEADQTKSELFGHVKGAYTGATSDREGLFAAADGGTLFLDEIADFPIPTQVMLLRALAEGEFRRLGESRTRRVKTRVLAATNRALEDLVVQREFRHDLFFRLSYFRLMIPPLRERGDDWLLIARWLLRRLAVRQGPQRSLHPDTVELMRIYRWPGNIRELEAAVVASYSSAEGCEILPEDMRPSLMWGDVLLSADPVSGPAPAAPVAGVGSNRSSYHTAAEVRQPEAAALFDLIVSMGKSFWQVVHQPFLRRDLNKDQVRALIFRGLAQSNDNYKQLVALFNMESGDYQKFMDFLRTHDLKPKPGSSPSPS